MVQSSLVVERWEGGGGGGGGWWGPSVEWKVVFYNYIIIYYITCYLSNIRTRFGKIPRLFTLQVGTRVAIIGASLSEPHTSVTAFAEVVCMFVCLRPYTVNFK